MRHERLRSLIGCAFFGLACVLAGLSALRSGSLAGWLSATHNGLLACLYLQRTPARALDRTGLWLGLIAAFLPVLPQTGQEPVFLILLALPGYALILWSLAFLGPRFGVTPADRGLVSSGPYACLRHPMYLGELLLRTVFIFTAQERFSALLIAAALVIIQVERIRREEGIIAGYTQYQEKVRWRLLPYVW